MRSLKSYFLPSRLSFWPLQIGGWLFYVALNFTAGVGEGKTWTWIFFSLSVAGGGFVLTCLLRFGYRSVWNLSGPRLAIAAAAMVFLATLIQMKLYVMVMSRFCDDCEIHSIFGYLWYFASMLYLMLSWSGMYFGIKFSQQLQAQKEAALKAQAMAHEAQLKMLRYQLNPHFLFNTLNAISTLVLDGRSTTANSMVGSLSAFLRYSLDSDPVQRVTLAQEIEASNLYLGIEQLRFGDRLRVSIDATSEAKTALVPSLILQPLIENAVKYAVAKREEGGSIEIEARRRGAELTITLRDDGPGSTALKPDSNGRGVGLRNTRERLRVLYEDRHEFTIANRVPHGLEITIRLPFEAARVIETAEAHA